MIIQHLVNKKWNECFYYKKARSHRIHDFLTGMKFSFDLSHFGALRPSRKKKKSPCGEMHPNYAMLVLCRAGHGKAVDGVEADITGPPPHAKIGTLRRNLYCRNHVRTSYDTPDGLRSREGQASLCWLLCSERGPSPERKKKSPTYIRNTIKAENVILKAQVRRPQCCINELLSLK